MKVPDTINYFFKTILVSQMALSENLKQPLMICISQPTAEAGPIMGAFRPGWKAYVLHLDYATGRAFLLKSWVDESDKIHSSMQIAHVQSDDANQLLVFGKRIEVKMFDWAIGGTEEVTWE